MSSSPTLFSTSSALGNLSQRLTTLSVSILVAASAGTNYVFSAYGPQLASRLHIEQTQLNLIGLAGNVGVYSTSPLWGRIVDSRGPRIPLASAFGLLLIGYSGIRALYNAGPSDATQPLSNNIFFALLTFSYMTGAGGCAALNGAGNPTAKSFPNLLRATATGLVLSGFGLSAFIFSTIANVAFSGDTSSFLLLLAIGTSIPTLVGYFFIRVIPIDTGDSPSHSIDSAEDCQTPLLPGHAPGVAQSILAEDYAPLKLQDYTDPDVSGWALWRNEDFWCLFMLYSILSGTGLMYINNVGSMARILYAHESETFSKVDAGHWQAAQVSILSIMNCSGRIIIGLTSDFLSSRLSRPRSYCVVLAAALILLSQTAAANIGSVQDLWFATAMLGLGYGSVAAISPILSIDYFGLAHFSEATGYIGLSPLILGNAFSIMFGWNLDAHQTENMHPSGSKVDSFGDPHPKCTGGRTCYVSSLYITMTACLIGLCISIWMARRDRRRQMSARKRREDAVVWGILVE